MMVDGFFLYPLLTVAFFHLGARAMITEFLWSRYPAWLAKVAECSACSGFWYGLACGVFGLSTDTPFLGSHAWYTVPLIGLSAIVWTPVLASVQEEALYKLSGAAVTPDKDPPCE